MRFDQKISYWSFCYVSRPRSYLGLGLMTFNIRLILM